MKHIRKIIALMLVLCTLLPVLPISPISAATPSTMTVADLAAASANVASQLQTAINAAPTNGGVRYDVAMPKTITVGKYSMGLEDYALMAAQAICAIRDGNTSAIKISYKDVSLTGDIAQGANISTVDKAMILDLATRTMKFGITLSKLPTSFIRPVGDTIYEGRICIYSVAYIFAQALSAYATNEALPVSVPFTPTSYTASTPSEPESSEGGSASEPNETVAPTADWYAPVAKAAYELEQYVLKNKDLPTSVTVNGQTFNMPEFCYLCCDGIVGISEGKTSGELSTPDLKEPENPQDTINPGNMDLAEIIERAAKYKVFCDNNGQAPNYMNTSMGFMQYQESVYFFAKVMSAYYQKGSLPNTCSVNNWVVTSGNYTEGDATFGANYSSLSSYITPTKNCPSTNATIIAVAKTGMYYSSGTYGGYAKPTSTYQAIFNLFEYLNDKTSYEYYYDTSRGALGVWRDKYGNCCDMAHLMIACSRSLGVPGRYAHGYCHFSSMSTGHVWATIYCGNKWYTADLVSNYNYLGYKTNTTGTFYNYYRELPF